MTTPKTPKEIMEEYREVMNIQEATGLRYNEDWLRSAMRSLLEYVEGSLPERYNVKPGDDWEDTENGYNIALVDCLAKIREIKDSI